MGKIDTSLPDFSNPDQRRAWVNYQLKLQGRSLASLARELGVVRHAPGHAFAKPYPKMERALADAVGIAVHTLFPERYSTNGERSIRMGRPTCNKKKSTPTDIINNNTTSHDTARQGSVV